MRPCWNLTKETVLLKPENTHRRRKDHCTSGLEFGFDPKNENMLLFVCSEVVESKHVSVGSLNVK